ncbi:siderophore biosynthesis lipase/esteras-like protein [Polychaeton citri CBS 116435]|uniref:Siderophore biosynthesis lipase/esteras-like protein n=1 Tax=Polychaeton citri CBS 116435 TaxID=1314669 RepID=A0A9P4Q1R1_9PEZI|nr:siderophore biosynthesis lipase/esteras-like protein [Polychaeton citri CBS 116435]
MAPSGPHARQGTLHNLPVHPTLTAFEPLKPLTRNLNINTLLWVGGLFDSPGSVDYPFALAEALPPTWALAVASLSSAGHSWGTSSIAQDAKEMSQLVGYFRTLRPGGKVVIMGHSTGCQDCMEYAVGAGREDREKVDGVVLQAPVSDREALDMFFSDTVRKEADELAVSMVGKGEGLEFLPYRLTKEGFGRCALTAKRWVDISSPAPKHDGADDYFSSDLETERLKKTFGEFPASSPLCILVSGNDEGMKPEVDKEALWKRWAGILKEGGGIVDEQASGVVEGAAHNLNGNKEEVVKALTERVVGFVGRLDQGQLSGGGETKV